MKLLAQLRAKLLGFFRWALLGESSGVRQSISGEGNLIQADGARLNKVEFDIAGDNNRIEIGPGCVINNVTFRLRGSNHRVQIGRDCRISRGAIIWFEDDSGLLQIGEHTTMVDVHFAVTETGSQITVGRDCMFANDIDIRTGDTHSVIDAGTGQRTNFASSVAIADHVWIAPRVVVLKGVSLGEDTIVATGSIVTRSFPGGVLIAGNPADVVKTGVTWKRERIPPAERA